MSQETLLKAVREHLSHVDVDHHGGRHLPLHPLYDEDGNWHMWIPDGKDGLLKIAGIPVECRYFAKEPAKQGDIRLFFLEFLNQRWTYPSTHRLEEAAYSDVQNLATSLAKLELIFAARDDTSGLCRMAATELEYIFLTCRSLFDIFQEVIARLWHSTKLHDTSLSKRNLPETYRKMVLHDNRLMSVEEIVEKHRIPEQIATAYHATSQFFKWLRQYRDYITHSGREFDRVFLDENGFAISIDAAPFSDMDIWCDTNTLPNNLGSLKSAACHIILTTINALESIIIAFQSVIEFPPPIVPYYAMFIRSPNIAHLAEMKAGIQDSPWCASANTGRND